MDTDLSLITFCVGEGMGKRSVIYWLLWKGKLAKSIKMCNTHCLWPVIPLLRIYPIDGLTQYVNIYF